MYTKSDLLQHLFELGINANGVLKVHISYKSIGEVDGRGDTVLDALVEYMGAGLLVLPSHTWDNVRAANPVMDVLHTPSCVGALTELFRKREGVYRSLHPTHSVAAIGIGAEDFVLGDECFDTPCAKNGSYYKLWERDAQVLLIGVNFSRNTIIHGFEEWENVAVLEQEKSDYYVINHKGGRLYTPQYRHAAPLGSETFTKLESPAMIQDILHMGCFGDATTRLMNAKPLRTLTAELLKDDPNYLLKY
ncbi:MAG: AAC(3) family N-acetyltransferase [Defluviitaleaceae bacterium]|nr:AAC(3) family N-acetyltransferase [Defluviitaleaceae bacterium]